MDTLTATGRIGRLVATLVAGALLIAGTAWGQDDHFPFGPFRMYSTAPGPDDPAPDTRVEGVDTTGAVVLLTERNTGIRRAEIEGQMPAYRSEPARLRQVADAYASHNPGASALVEVRIVTREEGVKDSRPTGTHEDVLVVAWKP
ncbi:hypothetical protein WEI85_36355 [Actinomycetes bacterium KLBMP 9797]